MTYDYSIYLVTDRSSMSTMTLCEAVEQAALGGCTMVQLRENGISSSEFYYLAKEVKKITDRYGLPLIINNRIDIALSVDAAGVHIGQKDIPADAARKVIGQSMLLGVSVSDLQEALRAQEAGADYLGVGAMFPTKTKKDAKIVPMEMLCTIRQNIRLPIVAIGGINRGNAARFAELGVDGLAVVSAIIARPDIRRATEELKQAFESASGKREV